MSPRRRQAQLSAQVSDDLVLVAPSSRAVWRVRKRPLEGRRIERKRPRFLKLIHGAAAYTILVALATGCITPAWVEHERWLQETYKDDYAACGFAMCRALKARPPVEGGMAEQQRQKSYETHESIERGETLRDGPTVCFYGGRSAACTK